MWQGNTGEEIASHVQSVNEYPQHDEPCFRPSGEILWDYVPFLPASGDMEVWSHHLKRLQIIRNNIDNVYLLWNASYVFDTIVQLF